jgi:hypothetical protein
MAVARTGSKVVVTGKVAGSVFPTSEVDIVYPVLIDGSRRAAEVGGAVYGRTLELRGDVYVGGPVVVRGDMRLSPGDGTIRLKSGMTVNGSVNGVVDTPRLGRTLSDSIRNASLIIKGDVAVNQNLALRNAVVFGSVRSVNCTLQDSLVLGTCIAEEKLRVSMSTIGGYACRDVEFEGRCAMLHAIGESRSQPLFLPFEAGDGTLSPSDVRFYPAVREQHSLMNRDGAYAEYSALHLRSDWVQAQATPNRALEEDTDDPVTKWVLSIGGRVADLSKLSQSVNAMAQMLKCGFEFEHYAPARRATLLSRALEGLTDEEAWILSTVCEAQDEMA